MKVPAPEGRRAIVANCDFYWIVSAAEAKKIHDEFSGARWLEKKRPVHRDEVSNYFPLGPDGLCESCRSGGRCEALKLGGVDISAAAPRAAPRDLLRSICFGELRAAIDKLPREGRRLLRFAEEHIDELSDEKIAELHDLFRDFGRTAVVTWRQPPQNVESMELQKFAARVEAVRTAVAHRPELRQALESRLARGATVHDIEEIAARLKLPEPSQPPEYVEQVKLHSIAVEAEELIAQWLASVKRSLHKENEHHG